MYFIDSKDTDKFSDMILEMPAIKSKNPDLKKSLKNILMKYFEDIYLKNPEAIKKFMNYEIDNNYLETFFDDYGINKKYLNKINVLFKKSLAYYLESLYQVKGSVSVLSIFAKIFENIFQGINFYQIIVTRKENITDNNGHKTRNFLYNYELEPLIINNRQKVLMQFNNPVSLTGKHLMDLKQYSDFNVFPVRTNLIYIQFTSTQANVDNDKSFNQIIQAYSLTKLSNIFFDIKHFYNINVKTNGLDIFHILKYADVTRLRIKHPKFSFHYNDKLMHSLIFSTDHIETIEEILFEYKSLEYKDRNSTKNLFRKWKYLISQYGNVKRLYKDYNELEAYLNKNNKEYVKLIQSFKEDDYTKFYIDLYNQVINRIDQNDTYLILYVNFLFLNLITNEAFIDNFFMPVYNLFQHYFFPIEMDFLNKLSEEYVINDKFESFGTSETFNLDISLGGFLDKYLTRPDEVKVFFVKWFKDKSKFSDRSMITVKSNINDLFNKKDENSVLIYTRNSDTHQFNNDIYTIVKTNEKNTLYTKDDQDLLVKPFINDNQKIKDQKNILIKANLTNEKQINDIQNINLNLTFGKDKVLLNDKENEEVKRANYLNYNNLDTYLIFYNEQFRKESSYLDNLNYKDSKINDNLYFTMHKLF